MEKYGYTRVKTDETIKVICTFCDAINDVPVERWISKEGYRCMNTNGLSECWYCKRMFWWDMTQETIEKLFN